MYWSCIFNGTKYYSWGQPQLPNASSIQPEYIPVYCGEKVNSNDKAILLHNGNSKFGLGDFIWLTSFLREWNLLKGRNKCPITFGSSEIIVKLIRNFLPPIVQYTKALVQEDVFQQHNHKLASLYYWPDRDGSDKSWIRNRSIVSRSFAWAGMQYEGLPDWRIFSPNQIIYPDQDFYNKLQIDENENYVFFQWHSSGKAKNLPNQINIKLLQLLAQLDYDKIYVIGMYDNLDQLERINKVINLSGKTSCLDVFTLAANASLIISPDSGGIHLGEAFRVPAVGITATLPPNYIAYKYKVPAFITGSGFCPYKPCGHVHDLPHGKCPNPSLDYCQVLENIDQKSFLLAIQKTRDNVNNLKSCPAEKFYNALHEPMSP